MGARMCGPLPPDGRFIPFADTASDIDGCASLLPD